MLYDELKNTNNEQMDDFEFEFEDESVDGDDARDWLSEERVYFAHSFESMKDRSIKLSKMGVRVIPTRKDGNGKAKIPMEREWQKRGIATEAEINAWKNDGIGVLAGGKLNLIIIDLDKEDGRSGVSESVAVEMLGDTFIERTVSGGWHGFYMLDDKVRLDKQYSVDWNGKKISLDILSDGSQCIVAPTPGYNVYNSKPVANKLPDWVGKMINSKAQTQTIQNTLNDNGELWIADGERNSKLLKILGKCRYMGMEDWAIDILGRGIVEKHVENPNDDKDPNWWKNIIENVKKFPIGKDPSDEDAVITTRRAGDFRLLIEEHRPINWSISDFRREWRLEKDEEENLRKCMKIFINDGLMVDAGKSGKSKTYSYTKDLCRVKNPNIVVEESFDIHLPLMAESLGYIDQHSLVLCHGESGTGKSALAMNIILLNMQRMGRNGMIYFDSEQGDNTVTRKFRHIGITQEEEEKYIQTKLDWELGSLPQIMLPDGLNIIDYLSPDSTNLHGVKDIMIQLKRSLRKGVIVVMMQTTRGTDLPNGGMFALHEPAFVLKKGWNELVTQKIREHRIPGKEGDWRRTFNFVGGRMLPDGTDWEFLGHGGGVNPVVYEQGKTKYERYAKAPKDSAKSSNGSKQYGLKLETSNDRR